jgi:hypothetical protein
MKPVKIQDVVAAVDFQSEELSHYYDSTTGEVVMLMGEEIRAAEEGLTGDDYPEWQRKQIELATLVLSDDAKRFIPLPDQFDVEEYRLMERFAFGYPDPEVSRQLADAIRGRGAFRRFKDGITRLGVAEEWYEYWNAHVTRLARDWCDHNRIPFIV